MIQLPRFASSLRLLSLTALVLGLFAAHADAATRILRVRTGATFITNTTDGSSWDKAFPELWRALDYVRFNIGSSQEDPVEIWLSTGTFKPDILISGNHRFGTFTMRNWVTIRGGFAGNETSPDQRAATAMTVLSGDVAGAQGILPSTLAQASVLNRLDPASSTFAENVYNVVTAVNVQGVVLERLIIARGYAAQSTLSDADIEDMYLPEPNKLETSGSKRAIERGVAGGGLYVENTTASTGAPNVTLNDCVFVQNYARGFGGGIAVVRAKVVANSTHFFANLGRLNGGAYFGRDQDIVFNSAEFTRNASRQSGGAVSVESPVRVPAGWKTATRAFFLGRDESRYQSIVGNAIMMAKMNTGLAPYNIDDLVNSLMRDSLKNMRDEYNSEFLNKAINASFTQDLGGFGSNPYGLVTKIMLAAKVGANVAKSQGSTDPISTYILEVISPNFELYGTPNGWASLIAGEISKAMGTAGPTSGQLKDVFSYLARGGGRAEFNDCRFFSNRAALDGSAIDALRVDVTVQRGQFSENSAGNNATINAAAFARLGINNSIFSGNSAARHSVVSVNQLVFTRLTNCTIVNNTSTGVLGHAVAVETGAECRIINSILWGNTNANGINATGGADVFTGRFDNLDAPMRQGYQEAGKSFFRYVGLTEIANSNVQGLSRLTQTWDRNSVEYLTDPAYVAEEGNLRVRIYMTDLAEEDSSHDTWDVMIVGQGDRFLNRGNFSADPQLHSSFMPKFGSPVLTGGSYKRLHALYSTAGFEDFFGAPWPRYPSTTVGIGAVAAPSLPSGTGGEVAGRYFVRPTATGDGSGRNWANATADLKATLAIAGAEVWVAAGTYYPSHSDSNASFTLGAGTQAYGGFTGTETARNERDYEANVTILSGSPSGSGTYHVVRHTGVNDAAVLDGFTIQNGRANGSVNTDNARGAGIFHDNSQVTLRNLRIYGNTATSEGGGLYSRNGLTSTMTNVTFSQNTANKGGAIYSTNSLDADRCQFLGNQAVQYGAAVHVEQSAASSPVKTAIFTNSVFQNNRNTGAGLGSAIYLRYIDLTLLNVTVFGNRSGEDVGAGYMGAAVYVDTGSVDVRNSILYGNRDSALGNPSFPIEQSQIYVPYENIRGTAIYLNNLMQGYRNIGGGGGAQRVAPNASGNFDAAPNFSGSTVLPQANSPFLNRGTGDADPQRAADVAGNPRKIGSQIDPGAYEYQGASQVLFASVSVIRSITPDGATYTFNFLATAPSGTTYNWMVNKNDGRGFVTLPADARITGQGTTSLTVSQPGADMEGWSFRVDASGAATASVSGSLTGISRDRIYVNGAVATSGDGKTWATAYKTIPEATKAAQELGVTYAQLWVAQGTYTTAMNGIDRTFFLYPGQSLYGGFKGGETSLSQRNPSLYPTILSGFQPTAEAASQHASAVLLVGPNSASSLPIVVDGVTIRDATQDALYIDSNVTPTISNCVIENRFATGASVLRSATFKNVIFRKNMKGGARVAGGTVTFENVLFAQNERASGDGGALQIYGAPTVIVKNSTLADNYAGGRGGGIALDGGAGTVTVDRSILWNNRDTTTDLGGDIEAAQLSRRTGTLTVTHSLVEKLTAYAGNNNLGLHPLFNDPVNFNFTLAAQSPAIALNAGAYPYSGTPGTTLNFSNMSPSTEERTSIFTKTFTLAWAASAGYSVTWQIDYGQGWVAPGSPFASASSGATGSTLVLNSSNILPSLRVRAVTSTGVALPPIALKVIPPIVRYVRADAPANGDGLSWATAFRHPNEALAKVPSLGVELWIARGTYGTSSYDNRLIAGVTLFGGFVGNETSLSQRSVSAANPTRLTSPFRIKTGYMTIAGKQVDSNIFGRQLAMDGIRLEGSTQMLIAEGGGGVFRNCEFVTTDSSSSGAYSVLLRSSAAVFDGCTFTGATESAVKVSGGSPTFRNSNFTGNLNRYGDGGAINAGSGADLTVDRCVFINNSSTYNVGGAIFDGGSSLTVTNSTFAGNAAGTSGGAIYSISNIRMVNCTLTANQANQDGAGVFVQGAGTLTNSIFWGNRTPPDIVFTATEIENDQISRSIYSSGLTVRKSIVEGLLKLAGNDNLPYNPLFSGSLGSPYALTAASPAIGRGDLTALDNLAPVAGYPGRLAGGSLDLGAYEFSGTATTSLQLTKAPTPSTSLYSGGNAVFSVAGESFLVGSTLTHIGADTLWQKFVGGSWVNLTSGVTLSNGNTESTLTLNGLTESGSYRYVIPSRGFTSNTFAITVTPRPIVYVDSTVATSGNGTSWGSPFKTIDQAVAVAGAALEIRVAAGNYTPNSLTIRPGLFFRGGYPTTGTAAQRNTQDPVANLTRLNGSAILRADGTNKIYNTDTGFEGFIITPTRSYTLNITRGANLFFRHCVFADLPFQGKEGAVFVDFGSSAVFEDCTFRNNNSVMVSVEQSSSVRILRANVYNNTNHLFFADLLGSLTIEDSRFTGNQIPRENFLIEINNTSSNLTFKPGLSVLARNRFWGNSGGMLLRLFGPTELTDSLFYVNTCPLFDVGYADVRARHLTIADNTVASYVDLTSSDRSPRPRPLITHYSGEFELSNSILWNNRSTDSRDSLEVQQIKRTGGTFLVRNNLIEGFASFGGTDNFTAAPLFAAQTPGAAELYQLLPQSPAIGAGLTAGSTSLDVNRVGRTGPPDLGALDFTGTPAAKLSLASTPNAIPTPYFTARSFTVTGANAGTNVQWWRWDGTQLVALDFGDTRLSVTTTADSSTVTLRNVNAGDTTGFIYTVNGSTFRSGILYVLPQVRQKIFVNPARARVNSMDYGDGLSWATAYTHFGTAYDLAPSDTDLYVMAGNHSLTYGATVAIRSGLRVYGGFTSTSQTDLAQRPAVTGAETVLGQYWFTSSNAVEATLFDGFTFSGTSQTALTLTGTANLTLRNCFVADANSGISLAGANARLMLENCTFRNFKTSGLVVQAGTLNGTNVTFSGANAALTVKSGFTTLTQVAFTGVDAGRFSLVDVSGTAVVTLNRVTAQNNRSGPAFTAFGGALVLRNALITGNTSSSQGAVNAIGGDVSLIQSTVYGNTGSAGNGGLFVSSGTLTAKNSIVWGNRGRLAGVLLNVEQQQARVTGGTLTANHNLIEEFATLGGTGNFSAFPFFLNPTAGDFNLVPLSPAINTGDTALSTTGFTTDLAGAARVVGSAPDLGAYEFQGTPASPVLIVRTPSSVEVLQNGTATFVAEAAAGGGGAFTWEREISPGVWQMVTNDGIYTVTVNGNTSTLTVNPVTVAANQNQRFRWYHAGGNGFSPPLTLSVVSSRIIYVVNYYLANADGTSWDKAYPTLAQALANWDPNAEIWVAGGGTAGHTFTTALTLPEGMRIYGGFSGGETKLADRPATGRTLLWRTNNATLIDQTGTPVTRATVLDGFILRGGGARVVYLPGASPTIRNSTFEGNTNAISLETYQAEPLIENCIFAGNYYSVALREVGSSSSIVDCTFAGNYLGAAVRIEGNLPGKPTQITDTLFTSCRAGGVIVASGSAELNRVQWTGNPSINQSGALRVEAGATATVRNSLLADNKTTSYAAPFCSLVDNFGTLSLINTTITNNVTEAFAYAAVTASTVRNFGTLTVKNSILWENQVKTYTQNALGLTTEQQQLYNAAGSTAVTYSIVSGLTGYANSHNTGYHPLFDSAYPGEYRLSRNSPALNSGDNTAAAGSVDFLGAARLVGGTIDLGAYEFAETSGIFSLGLTVETDSAAREGFVPVSFASGGELVVTGSPATIQALLWETLVNGEWVPLVTGGDFTVFAAPTGTGAYSATLRIAPAASDELPDRSVRFRINGTSYESPTYVITTSRRNIRYVRATAGSNGDGLTWASAYNDLATAVAAAPLNTELWITAGTYTGADITLRPTLRLYGGFAGNESIRTARSTNRELTTISHNITANLDGNYPKDIAVFDGLRFLGNTVTLHYRGGSFRNVKFEAGGGLRAPSYTGSLLVEDSLFLNNLTALSGFADTATLTRVTFTGNEVAIRSASGTAWTIQDCTFDASVNRTEDFGPHYLTSQVATLTVLRSSFLNANSRTPALSLGVSTTTTSFTDCVFSGNKTTFNGAGVFDITGGTVNFDRCSFLNNRADANSSFANASVFRIAGGAAVSLRNSYLAGNVTTAPALPPQFAPHGAIFVNGSTLNLTGVTLVNNTATAESIGGIVLQNATATITNSVLYGNNGSGGTVEQRQLQVWGGSNLTLSHTLIEGLATYTGTALIGYSPRFVIVNNRLVPATDSPLRDTGDASVLVTDEKDLFGNARAFGPGVDLGAVEPTTDVLAAAYDIGLTRRVAGGYLEITFDNSRGYTGLVWQFNDGSGWQTFSVPSGADTTSGNLRILRLPWLTSYEGVAFRLSSSTYTTASYVASFGDAPPANGSVTTATPASGSTAGSTRPAITFTYDQAVADNQLTPASFVVHSSMHGRLHNSSRWGTVTTDLLSPVLTPGLTFTPGESIDVSSTRAIFGKLGGAFHSYVSRFTIPWTSRYGRFRQSDVLPTTGTITGAAAGDINGDGQGDVMFTGDDGAWIYLGDGDGGFTHFQYGATGNWNAFALADFNGDGRIDFIGSRDRASLTVETLDVAGATTTNLLASPLAYAGSRLLPGDFNGDGRQDVLVLGPSTTDGEVLLLNNGDGTFSPADAQRFAPAGDRTREAAVADINHDGALDFVQLRATSGDLIVWLNNGAGVFTSDNSVRVANAQTFALTDSDRDGWTDLIVASDSTADSIFVFRNDQTGRFVQQRAFAAGQVKQLAAADFDADGDIDLLVITGTAADTLWTCNSDGTYTATALAWTSYNASNTAQLAVADLNADGSADVAIPQASRVTFWTAGHYFTGFTKTLAEATSVTLNESDFTGALTQNVNTTAGVYPVDSYALLSLPAHGKLKLNGVDVALSHRITFGPGRTYTYVPTGHYFGTDSFRVAPRDYINNSPGARIILNVTRVVDAPTTTNQTVRAFLNTARVLTLLATHPENEAMTFAITTAPAHGSATVSGNQATYTPATNYLGADSFGYTVSDGFGNSATGTVTIDVSSATELVTNANLSGAGSLAAAINTVLTQGGGRIAFSGLPNDTTLYLGTATDTVHGPTAVLVSGYLELDGTGTSGLTLARHAGTANLRLFRVTSTGSLVLKGLTLADGAITSETAGTPARGAAIYNEGTLRIDDTAFLNHYAHGTADAGAEGGAIYSASGSLALAHALFVDNRAEDDSTAGRGGALFLRNTDSTVSHVNFSGNLAPTSGTTAHLLAEDAAMTVDWTNTEIDAVSAATLGTGTLAVRDHNAQSYAVATFSPSVGRVFSPSQIRSVTNFDVTLSSATAELTVTADSYRDYGGTNPATVEVVAADGAERTIRFSPAPADDSGTTYGGYVTLALTVTEAGIAYTHESEVVFLADHYAAPEVADQDVYVINEAPATFTLTASHLTQVVTLELLAAPAHGTLSPAFDPAIKTYTYTPEPGYEGEDYLLYRANTVQDIPASARITFRNVPSTRQVTTADTSGPGSLADILARIPAGSTYNGTQWRINFSSALAGQTITLPSTALATPAGPSAIYVSHNLTLDATDAPGLRIVRADSAPAMRLITVAPGAELFLTKLTLANGLALGAPGQPGRGGALYVGPDAYALIDGVTFEANTAAGGDGANGQGGAIYNDGGELSFYGAPSRLANNSAIGGIGGTGRGGAIYQQNGSLGFYASYSGPATTFADNLADADENLALIADGTFLFADFDFTNVDHVGTSGFNGGIVIVDAGYSSIISGPGLITVAPIEEVSLLSPGGRDIPLTLTGGVPDTIDSSEPVLFAIAGTLANPILRISGDTFTESHSTIVSLGAPGYAFNRLYATPTLVYSPPTASLPQDIAVTMNQPVEFGLDATFNPNLTATYQLLGGLTRMEAGNPVAGDAGTLTGAAPNFTFTPPAQFTGTIQFAYEISDGADSAIGVVRFQITSGWPYALDDQGEAQSGINIATQFSVFGGHDTGDTITYHVATPPSHGTVQNSGGTELFTYTTDGTNYVGSDSFTFVTRDSLNRESPPATFTVNVLDIAAYQKPVVTGLPAAPGVLLPDRTNLGDPNMILANVTVTDADSPTLTVTLPTPPKGYFYPEVDGWDYADHPPYGDSYRISGSPAYVTEKLRGMSYYAALDNSAPPGTIVTDQPMIIVTDERPNHTVAAFVPVRGIKEYASPRATPGNLTLSTPPATAITFQYAPFQAQGRPFQISQPYIFQRSYSTATAFSSTEVTYDATTGTLTSGSTVIGTLTGGPTYPAEAEFVDVTPGAVYTYTFTPAAGFVESLFVIWELSLKSDPQIFSGSVAALIHINQAPVANLDTTTRGQNALTIPVASLLANDTDPDAGRGDSISFVSVATTSANGVALSLADDTITYAASALTGDDSFTYTVKDSRNVTATGTVNVLYQNTAPTPANDTMVRTYGQPLAFAAGLLLANDSDPENDTIAVSAVAGTSTQGGTVTLVNGVITYTPPSGTTLSDSFTYTVTDSRGASTDATVTLTIANRAPLAGDLTVTRYNNQPKAVTESELVALASDPDGDTVQVTRVDALSVLGADITRNSGTISYQTATPRLVRDEDYFTYSVEDAHGAAATGYITVQLVNRAPVVTGETLHRYNTSATTTTTLAALLANDSDPDGDTLTVDSVASTSAQGGTITVVDGIVTYTPPTLPFGTADSFGYTVIDEQGATSTGTVTLVVDNRAPTPAVDSVNRFNTEPATVTVVTLLANDTDPDGDALTFVSAAATSAQGATISVADGTVTYTAASPTAITGDDTFTYKVKDSHNVEATATVTVHLVNRAPTPQNNVIDRYNDQPGTITVTELLANDTDPDGDALTFVSVSGTSTQGATVTVASGTITYTASGPGAITGDDTFTYTVKDPSDETASATVTVKLLNRAPTAVADTVSRAAGQPATVTTATLLANDTDPDGDTLTFVSADTTSAQGVPITVSGGTISYTPAAFINGADTFTYTMEDVAGVTATATVTVTTLTPPNAAVMTVTARSGGGVNLALTGAAFTRYALEVSTDLVTWTALTTVTTDATGHATAADTTAPAEGAARFYRSTAN